MKIGFAYNLKDPETSGTDTHAEYETRETIEAITAALSCHGTVIPLPCDYTFIDRIMQDHPDLVFNIAEGWGARDRESFVPIVCRMCGIPCTGSDAVALGITMDKALTKRICHDAGIATTPFEVYTAVPDEPPPFGFPAFVKPNEDGSSRGITGASRVHSFGELQERVSQMLTEYKQSALVEPYLDGRDFCVGLLGNNPPQVLPTCEVLLGHEDGIPFFSFEYKRHDTDRLDFSPDIPAEILHRMEDMARTAWDVLDLLDYTRFDFRTDASGTPHLLEINALPGLSPISGIFVRQTAAAGIGFDTLIHTILSRTLSGWHGSTASV